MRNELRKEFFGDIKFSCGKLIKPMHVKVFENRFNVKFNLKEASSNEYGSCDCYGYNKEGTLTVCCEFDKELKYVTHVNVWDED